jgi:hypothetical protein
MRLINQKCIASSLHSNADFFHGGLSQFAVQPVCPSATLGDSGGSMV